ncbi:proprotein convertase P-domain-containing protein, partial [Streptomyces javensis]|uniref:proprotein convertase P-domain-containing protein n=1 Tax=Streptomyces javensis TaxID=114698 RepID=UPI0033D34C05
AKVINGVSYNSPTYDNLPVTGIGRDNAEKIWFKALSQRMTSNTNYAGARDATLWAAGELFGQGSAQYNAVAGAWAGVNVGARIADGVTVTPPGDQTSIVNQATSLQITATSSNPGALSYAADGLPAGLAINSSSGLISGTPTTEGSSSVTVTVTDSAGKTGTASFTWTVSVSGGNVFENTADIAIPDAGEPITSPISVSRAGNAPSNLQVGVDIVHSYRGDLAIDLVAPDGTAYRLKDASLFDSADDVRTTYTVNASSETAVGTWKLRVQDMYAQDTGYINSWKLTF